MSDRARLLSMLEEIEPLVAKGETVLPMFWLESASGALPVIIQAEGPDMQRAVEHVRELMRWRMVSGFWTRAELATPEAVYAARVTRDDVAGEFAFIETGPRRLARSVTIGREELADIATLLPPASSRMTSDEIAAAEVLFAAVPDGEPIVITVSKDGTNTVQIETV